mmetsp:Transcript_46219/g.124108  ORF Transcript_46219/g.124108 Transcript_46219/m.124108 type:complete len:202 (-) Transcript_46219:40-645(-)
MLSSRGSRPLWSMRRTTPRTWPKRCGGSPPSASHTSSTRRKTWWRRAGTPLGRRPSLAPSRLPTVRNARRPPLTCASAASGLGTSMVSSALATCPAAATPRVPSSTHLPSTRPYSQARALASGLARAAAPVARPKQRRRGLACVLPSLTPSAAASCLAVACLHISGMHRNWRRSLAPAQVSAPDSYSSERGGRPAARFAQP